VLRVSSRHIRKWEQLLNEFEKRRGDTSHWIFRGLADAARCELKPSLERCKEKYDIPGQAMGWVEGGLIRRFKRNYYHYSSDAPDDGDYIEWLALMRHHGAPTRLLDWTHSFFIALFFALERSNTPAVVWALNESHLDTKVRKRWPKIHAALERSRNVRKLGEFKKSFGHEPPVAFVSAINPYRLNQRLTVQQGTFLAQGDLATSFEENLAAVIGNEPSDAVLVKLIIDDDREFRRSIQQRLHRMGINNAALFPGLDGFAHSLEQILNFHGKMLPPDAGFLTPQELRRIEKLKLRWMERRRDGVR